MNVVGQIIKKRNKQKNRNNFMNALEVNQSIQEPFRHPTLKERKSTGGEYPIYPQLFPPGHLQLPEVPQNDKNPKGSAHLSELRKQIQDCQNRKLRDKSQRGGITKK